MDPVADGLAVSRPLVSAACRHQAAVMGEGASGRDLLDSGVDGLRGLLVSSVRSIAPQECIQAGEVDIKGEAATHVTGPS